MTREEALRFLTRMNQNLFDGKNREPDEDVIQQTMDMEPEEMEELVSGFERIRDIHGVAGLQKFLQDLRDKGEKSQFN